MPADRLNPPQPDGPVAAGLLFQTATVFVLFALFATIRAPIPAVNEPHYLSKAKHVWNPAWCSRDLFLESSNAHLVFYQAIGGLTRFLSLDQTAWVGRILGWSILAWGWTRLASFLVPGRVGAILSACVFLGLATIGNLSGEWLVGGVEAKVFSYGFLCLAIHGAFRKRWFVAAIGMGLAIGFHPIVGIWGYGAGMFALVWIHLSSPEELRSPVSDGRQPVLKFVLLACVFFIAALPGLIPAMQVAFNAPSAEVAHAADALLVFDRLDHHLDPTKFHRSAYVQYGVMLVAWAGLCCLVPETPAERLFFRFVIGTTAIAVGGLVVGCGPRWAGLMKFYPFRLFDVFLPAALAFTLAALAQKFASTGTVRVPQWISLRGAIAAVLFLAAGIAPFVFSAPDRNPGGLSGERPAQWREVCVWIADNTPPESLFLTPKFNFGFKWYAGRAEYVAWKDCPQDAASLLEWKRRLNFIYRWRVDNYSEGYSPAEIVMLRDATDIDFIVAWNADQFQLPPLFRNESFSVYRLTPPATE